MLLINFKTKFNLESKTISMLSLIFILASSVSAETLNPKLSKVANSEDSILPKQNSVFVVSDEELQTYSNTAELIRELKVVRQDKDTLLDYSKKLREKFKNLESYCSKDQPLKTDSSTNVVCDDSSELSSEVEVLKKDLSKKNQEVQNIKIEHEALKIKFKEISENYAKLSGDTNKDISSVSILEGQLKQKTTESKACFEQLDQSQKLVINIPVMEKEILGLKNELLMRKSAAELLGSNGHLKQEQNLVKANSTLKTENSLATTEYLNTQESLKKVAQNKVASNNALGSDVMIVEVVGDKVTLRAGPGPNNSSIMDLARGARLTVEAREGNWFRVNSPTGGRAYINTSYVRVVENGSESSKQRLYGERTKPQKIASTDNELVGLDVEPVKPPLPEQPVKMNSRKKSKNIPATPDPVSPDEVLAMRELKKAMKQNSESGIE